MSIDLSSVGSADKYEAMIAELLGRELSRASVVRRCPGDGGIDVFSGSLSGEFAAFQVKYFVGKIGDSQKDQIRKSLRTAASRNPSTWTLVTATDFDEPTHRWFEQHVSKYPFPCDHWDANRVRGLLNTHFGIRQAYFGSPSHDALRAIAIALGGADPNQLLRPKLLDTMIEAQELLDVDNPDWGWERSFGAGGVVTMTPYPKHPAAVGEVEISLKFPPNDPDSDRVSKGWEDMLKKGSALSVPRRFVEKLVMKFGIEETFPGGDLRIEPHLDTPTLPAAFEFTDVNGRTFELRYVALRCVERGYEQFRLSNKEQGAAGTVSLAIKNDLSPSVSFSLELNVSGRRAKEVLPYARLMEALSIGGELAIRVLEPDALLSRMSVPSDALRDKGMQYTGFLEEVVRVEREFGVELPLTNTITDSDLQALSRLANVIDQGGYEQLFQTATLVGSSHSARVLLELVETHAGQSVVSLTIPEHDIVIFGTSVRLGPVQMLIQDALILDSIEYLREAMARDPLVPVEFHIGSVTNRACMRHKGWPRCGESELFSGWPPFD